jgi:hypothetical protein
LKPGAVIPVLVTRFSKSMNSAIRRSVGKVTGHHNAASPAVGTGSLRAKLPKIVARSRDSLRLGRFGRTTYGAIGRDRQVGFVARRLPSMDASPFSDAERGTQMIVLASLALFVGMCCGLRCPWLAPRVTYARQGMRE